MLRPMAQNEAKYLPEAQRLMAQFPGWDVWVSIIGGQWHARLKGATPPIMFHDNSAADLGEQIEQYVACAR